MKHGVEAGQVYWDNESDDVDGVKLLGMWIDEDGKTQVHIREGIVEQHPDIGPMVHGKPSSVDAQSLIDRIEAEELELI